MRKQLKNKRGFTIIELIVAIAVIAILVMLAAPYYQSQAMKATETLIRNDVKTAENAFEILTFKHKNIENEWEPSHTTELVDALVDARIYDERGVVEFLPEHELRIIPKKLLKEKIGSTLKGTFYMTDDENVYYVHDKKITDKKVTVLPEVFEDKDVDLAPFVYYQEQAKEAGSEKSTEEILNDYINTYFDETDGDYVIKPGKEAEVQLFEDGMKSMLEEVDYERFSEVSTVIVRDFYDACAIDYSPKTEPYKRVINYSASQSVNLYSNMVYHTWDSAQISYQKASDFGWIKFQHPTNPNIFLSIRRTSTATVITYEIVSSANERRIIRLNNTGVGYAWYGTTYTSWYHDAEGNYILRLVSNSGDSMGNYKVAADNVLCGDRPPAPIRTDSPLATNTPIAEKRNTAIVDYFKKTTMTTDEKINAINAISGGGYPARTYAMIQ